MKKVFDRVWEWMKSTAWFQVVLLVGVVVAIVLCISPITKGISNAISDNERAKYVENNRINFDELQTKVANIDSTGDEFAVVFGNTTNETVTNLNKGIEAYEGQENAVKIYALNTSVTEENHGTYDMDENWYNYYKFDNSMSVFMYEASYDVYNEWKDYTLYHNSEIEKTSDYGTSLPSLAIMWFRTSSNIDSDIKDMSTAIYTKEDKSTEEINMHIAKVYTTIDDSSQSDQSTKTLSGLQKFFSSSLLS